ncbi:RICIN domain-containing protein [Bacillus mycoides]|uniref:RICIN domain-containing protein n=1 Tax=Bacillus mycoides TaxID=1405 RepID=UPI003A8030CD
MEKNQQQISNLITSGVIQSLVFTSDPQYPWTDCTEGPPFTACSLRNNLSPCINVRGEDRETRRRRSEAVILEQYDNINDYTEDIASGNRNRSAAVFINGDVTEFGHNQLGHPEFQWNTMNRLFNRLIRPYYFGLGNHDIENNKDRCHLDWCFRDSIGELVNHVRRRNNIPDSQFDCRTSTVGSGINAGPAHEGSFSYTMDFGRICSIQLNNYAGMHARSQGNRWLINMRENIPWLRAQLTRARNEGKIIIINVHQTRNMIPTYRDLFQEFGVVAIFAGHHHTTVGGSGSVGNIPVFLSGSAMYRTYLILEQFQDRLEIFAVRCNDWRGNRQRVATIPIEPRRIQGIFQIVTALNNSSVLDLNGPNNVTLYSNNGGNHQRWNFTYDQSRNAYVIRNVSNQNLVLAWDISSQNRNVFAMPFNSGLNQQYWILEPFQNGYAFRNFHNPNLVLDVYKGGTANRTNVTVFYRQPAGSTHRNQTFLLRRV